MNQRIQVEKSTSSKREDESLDATADTKEALKAEMDALLDEIDGVLEENAEEFVAGYIQKGGQ